MNRRTDIRGRRFALGAGTALAGILAMSAGWSEGARADEQVTIASWGGSYQEAQSKALFQPAEEATGIKVVEET